MAGAPEGKGCSPKPLWSLADNDLPCRPALRSSRCALHHRRPHQWLQLSCYVEQILAPTLQPGDVVIIDNLASHKSRAVEKPFAHRRSTAVPAAYSPDLNPSNRCSLNSKRSCERQTPARSKPLGADRNTHQPLHAGRVRQLPHKCRICFSMSAVHALVGRLI